MRRFGRLAFLLLLLGVVGCDHTTKHAAESALGPAQGSQVLIPGLLELTLARNTDSAFTLLGNTLTPDVRLFVLLALSSLATLVVGVWVARRWKLASALERLAGALLLGGAIANVSDRALRGHVVDFIHVQHWPVFNLADVAICAGIALLLIASRRRAASISA